MMYNPWKVNVGDSFRSVLYRGMFLPGATLAIAHQIPIPSEAPWKRYAEATAMEAGRAFLYAAAAQTLCELIQR